MTLQQEVIKRLRCKPEINVEEEIRLTINFLKDYIKKNNFIKSLEDNKNDIQDYYNEK